MADVTPLSRHYAIAMRCAQAIGWKASIKTCAQCGQPFMAQDKSRITCGRMCGNRYVATHREQRGGRNRKAVVATSVETGAITAYPSIRSAEAEGFDASHISKCLGTQRTHKGHLWAPA